MGKKIMVLTGSPRKGGNSDMLADAFIAGAREAGHEVLRFDAGRADIGGCMDCGNCFSTGKACVFDDDFNDFAEMLDGVEVLVYITPMYFYTFPARIKAAFEKTYSFLVGQRPLAIKQAMLIVCGEDKDVSTYEGIVKSFQISTRYCKWDDLGYLIVPSVWEKGAVAGTNGCELAREAGRTLSAGNQIAAKLES